MGLRGPQKTPTKYLEARGSWRAKTRDLEPEVMTPDEGDMRPPRALSEEGRKVWKTLVPRLSKVGILSTTDMNAMVRYCQMMGQWLAAQKGLKHSGTFVAVRDEQGKIKEVKESPYLSLSLRLNEQLLRLEREFGLTPSARPNVQGAEPPMDPMKARYFPGG